MIGQFLWRRDEKQKKYVDIHSDEDVMAKDGSVHVEEAGRDGTQSRV